MKSTPVPTNPNPKIKNSLVKTFSLSQLPLRVPNQTAQDNCSHPQTKIGFQNIQQVKARQYNKATSEQYCLNSSKFEAISNSTEESESENLFKQTLITKQTKLSGSSKTNQYHSDGSMALKESGKLRKLQSLKFSREGSTVKFGLQSEISQKVLVNPKERLDKLGKLRNLQKQRYLNQLEKVILSEESIQESRQKNMLEVQLLERILESLRQKERLSKLQNLAKHSSSLKKSSHTETEEGQSEESLNNCGSSHLKQI